MCKLCDLMQFIGTGSQVACSSPQALLPLLGSKAIAMNGKGQDSTPEACEVLFNPMLPQRPDAAGVSFPQELLVRACKIVATKPEDLGSITM